MLIFQTTEEEGEVAKTAISTYEIKLEIGGETVIQADCLVQQGRTGARSLGNSEATAQSDENPKAAIFDQYIVIDFARQPWDCRGKTVNFSFNAGTADAVRVYPIYLVDA